jgi:ferredoxin
MDGYRVPGMSGELSPKNHIFVEVQRDVCIGSGDCVDSAPNVFQLDDEDKAVVVDPDGASVDEVIQAAGNCPVSAVFVLGEDGELYP